MPPVHSTVLAAAFAVMASLVALPAAAHSGHGHTDDHRVYIDPQTGEFQAPPAQEPAAAMQQRIDTGKAPAFRQFETADGASAVVPPRDETPMIKAVRCPDGQLLTIHGEPGAVERVASLCSGASR